ncbi:MAG TPA: cation diffusion facilitator family transporter [Methylomirabilota bacterium]|jgi:cation diffusion facilitator family transporter|nr:cation diffusion facilitator family transporter [Methylomirabilota bacterium]
MAPESRTAVVAALAGNAALAFLKGTTAAMTGSAAMLAETFHSLADTGNQVLLLVGMRLSKRPPDEARPFGYGMNTYFWAFVVSAMLFTLGGAFSIWEAVHKLLAPSGHPASPAAFFVLGGAFVFEAMSLGVAIHSVQTERGDEPLLRFVREARDPTLPTVLLEDSAALLSILVAAAGLALAHITGVPRWDALASGVIGLILLAVATFLAYENYSLLLGEPATAEQEEAIRERILADPAVRDVVSLHTMHLGPTAVLVATRVWFKPELTAAQVEEAVRRLEDSVRRALPGTRRRLILIEPARPERPAAQRAA